MCMDGKPNRNDLRDGECFWGFVVQWQNTGNGHNVNRRWMLLRFDARGSGYYFNAESNHPQRVDAANVHSWQYNTPPVKVPNQFSRAG